MDTKALREEFGKLQTEAQAVISAAAAAGKPLSAEDKAANDLRWNRLDTIRAQFDESNRFAKLQLEVGGATLPADPAGRDAYEKSEGRKTFKTATGDLDLAAVIEGINQFARTGDARQCYTVTTGTNSGAYLPKEVLAPISVKRLANCWRKVLSAYGLKAMEVDTSASFSIPVADDTANTGQTVSESATSGTALDPSQAGISISPTLWDSKALWFSNTVINSKTFDVLGFALPIAQKRIDKSQESSWTTNVITNGVVGVTTASPTAITYAELLTWEHSLAAAYRDDAAFTLADSLYKALRGLVDNNNRPVLDLDPSNTFVGKIHGKPVVVGDYFQTLAANHVTGAFVSASAIQIVDVSDARLARYSMLPTFPDQTGLELFQNGDFGFVSNGLALAKTAIS